MKGSNFSFMFRLKLNEPVLLHKDLDLLIKMEKEQLKMKTTLKGIIESCINPHIDFYFNEVYRERENLTIDGVKAFNNIDTFVAGKMVNAFTYLVLQYTEDHKKFEEYKQKLSELIDFASNLEFKTWGSLNCMTGLYRLKKHGILSEVVGSETQQRLKSKCDWRKFVNVDDLSLIKLPTNYYGVAFGVSRYMELMGWDNSGYSLKLFERLMEHIEVYSGGLGYMDETKGEGRFDRYSLLTPGELGAMLMETETETPARLLELLRKSCDIHLSLANEDGDGFSYGRSIGAYGDTSSMEVLSSAACLNILNSEEKELAYSFNMKIAEKFVGFWIDKDMKSVNLWDKGRRTDGYRNKNRILGENMSLCMQLVGVSERWTKAGFQDKTVSPDYPAKLKKLPKYSFYQFLHGEYDRGMAIIRDGRHVISLPLINGGSTRYQCTPYLPIPNSNHLFESGADTRHPNLVPILITDAGERIMPISYFKEMNSVSSDNELVISYCQDEMADLKEEVPQKFKGIKSETTLRFTKGCVERNEIYYTDESVQKFQGMFMEFASFSKKPEVKGNKIIFEDGDIAEIEVSGLGLLDITNVEGNQDYCTSHGNLQTLVTWGNNNFNIKGQKSIKWVIKYR